MLFILLLSNAFSVLICIPIPDVVTVDVAVIVFITGFKRIKCLF